MLIDFFHHLRRHELPVSIREYLTLLEALSRRVIGPSVDEFYLLARLTLVKDESLFDRYDRAFASYYRQAGQAFEAALQARPESPTGGERAGKGGDSPVGQGGKPRQGLRLGDDEPGSRSGARAWDMRGFREYDDQVELGTRNIKVALRRLRRFARQGAAEELDLDGTIRDTARNAGMLDLRMVPERRNTVKVLMLLDVGGTMDSHVARVEELFSAARSEFRHLEVHYFHNCLYDWLWQNGRRRHAERTSTWDVLRRHNPDWRLIFVGDATMSPHEILQPGGSTEYGNAEAGAVWLRRMAAAFPRHAWLNPEPAGLWPYRQSVDIIRRLMQGRMYPVTLAGLSDAMRMLSR